MKKLDVYNKFVLLPYNMPIPKDVSATYFNTAKSFAESIALWYDFTTFSDNDSPNCIMLLTVNWNSIQYAARVEKGNMRLVIKEEDSTSVILSSRFDAERPAFASNTLVDYLHRSMYLELANILTTGKVGVHIAWDTPICW